ncbi:MAG: ATP-binding protein [Pseudomonadota bacterium]
MDSDPGPLHAVPARLRLGVVGGGRRCLSLLRMMEAGELAGLGAAVLAVADPNPRAEGLLRAQALGIHTTAEAAQLLCLPQVDMIIELTGRPEVLEELAAQAPPDSRRVSALTSRLLSTMVDLGQRLRLSQEECSLAGALAQTLSSATEEGIMVLDANYRINRINATALRMAGLQKGQAVGRHCFEVSHHAHGPCDSPEHPCPMKQTMSNGLPNHAIHRHVDARGHSKYYNVSTYPVLKDQDRVVEVLEIFRDITTDLDDQVEMRTRDLKHNLAHLVQEDKLISLGKLVASVAHEINNPLASILNFSMLIHKSLGDHHPSEAEADLFRHWLRLTVGEAQRCGRIVSNLLSFARQQSLEPRRFNLGELLETILILVRHRMELADVVLFLEQEREGLTVWGDYSQLQQCVTNLIFNALEAMPQGGQLHVHLRRAPRAEQVWLSVTDTGPGIAPENLPYIFEPFFSTKTQGQGVGLGLSMVYGIMQKHGGEVVVESQPGQGTTFRLVLPVAPPAPPPAEARA